MTPSLGSLQISGGERGEARRIARVARKKFRRALAFAWHGYGGKKLRRRVFFAGPWACVFGRGRRAGRFFRGRTVVFATLTNP